MTHRIWTEDTITETDKAYGLALRSATGNPSGYMGIRESCRYMSVSLGLFNIVTVVYCFVAASFITRMIHAYGPMPAYSDWMVLASVWVMVLWGIAKYWFAPDFPYYPLPLDRLWAHRAPKITIERVTEGDQCYAFMVITPKGKSSLKTSLASPMAMKALEAHLLGHGWLSEAYATSYLRVDK